MSLLESDALPRLRNYAALNLVRRWGSRVWRGNSVRHRTPLCAPNKGRFLEARVELFPILDWSQDQSSSGNCPESGGDELYLDIWSIFLRESSMYCTRNLEPTAMVALFFSRPVGVWFTERVSSIIDCQLSSWSGLQVKECACFGLANWASRALKERQCSLLASSLFYWSLNWWYSVCACGSIEAASSTTLDVAYIKN